MRESIKINGRRRMCDTKTAKLKASRTVGEFGDESGFEEKLYQNRSGFWFVWGRGGARSPYPCGEEIRAADENFVSEALRNWNRD